MADFVDWDLAASTAATLGPTGPKVTRAEAAEVVRQLRELTGEAAGHVAEFTGLVPQVDVPPVRVVDRRDWAAVNVSGMRQVIGPLAARLSKRSQTAGTGAMEMVGAKLTAVQAGTVLAYLSGRVLGQYEVFSGEPGQLLLVAPNIVAVERKLGAEPRDFRLWVCLHEVTHRTQFTAVPWLRGHFLSEVKAFVDAADTDPAALLGRLRRAVSAAADAVRDKGGQTSVLDVVQTPGQRAVMDRLTALMTLVEGHAEVVMDGVGPRVIPSVDAIRARFDRRRATANPVESVIRRLLGVDAKLRQYAEGRKFVQSVIDRAGMAGFNKVWAAPENLPTLADLADPDAWVARVAP
ncbi:MAG: zinc-dependent metalloprotease [Hamadaea sp.]|nr:zinc-dependent metalloprotease [Hamadaea sp.]NUR48652.1 zinc-dependent metalloprotease [Hamadaea sp.]NUT03298.1 zinc-dependent metalloprotease [Hamadaea sp.]